MHKAAEWIKRERKIVCYEKFTLDSRTNRLKLKEWSESVKIVHENGNQIKAGVAILMSDKVEFKSKTVSTDKVIT